MHKNCLPSAMLKKCNYEHFYFDYFSGWKYDDNLHFCVKCSFWCSFPEERNITISTNVTFQFMQKKKQAVYSLSGLIFINTTEALFHSLERITTLPSDWLFSHWYLFFPLLLNINKTSNSTVLHDTATVYTLVLQRCSSQTSQARWRTSFLRCYYA